MSRGKLDRLGLMLRCLLLACSCNPSPARSDDTVHRSIRQAQSHPRDELGWPQFRERVSQLGWEVRTRHFTVTSTSGPAQARWLAEQLESTWTQLFRMADYWTAVHRQPTFAISSIGVMVTSDRLSDRGPAPGGPRPLNDEPNIYISLAPGQPSLNRQLPQIRREAVRSFFRVTDLDQTLPEWVQTGLADYYATSPEVNPTPLFRIHPTAGHSTPTAPQPLVQEFPATEKSPKAETPPTTSTASADAKPDDSPASPQSTPLPVFAETVPKRTAADRVAPRDEDRAAASLWTRYFLEANDAQYAPLLVAALAQDVAYRSAERLCWAAVSQGVWRPPVFPRRFDRDWQPGELLGTPAPQQRLNEWLAAPLSGQPILDASQLPTAELTRLAGEMTLILKLARRFDDGSQRVLQPAVSTFDTKTGTEESTTTRDENGNLVTRGLDLPGLYHRLSDPGRPAWATLDVNGRVLWWNDHQRLADLFDNPQRRYRSYSDQGRDVLQCATGTGRLLEVWLEDNPADASRPRAIARTRSAWQPRAEVDERANAR